MHYQRDLPSRAQEPQKGWQGSLHKKNNVSQKRYSVPLAWTYYKQIPRTEGNIFFSMFVNMKTLFYNFLIYYNFY